ncbi:MAG: hypothetical protein FWF01_04535 [Alphaproteobacteria bacterium]|nr:hypothetical protein [Alphaproteobacteria bacterium]
MSPSPRVKKLIKAGVYTLSGAVGIGFMNLGQALFAGTVLLGGAAGGVFLAKALYEDFKDALEGDDAGRGARVAAVKNMKQH